MTEDLVPSSENVFIRLVDEEEKESTLLEAVAATNSGQGHARVSVRALQSFRNVPGFAFSYWVSDQVRELFVELPSFETEGREPAYGLVNCDDFRFLRQWWEVSPEKVLARSSETPDITSDEYFEWAIGQTCAGKGWVTFTKGGDIAPFYSTLTMVVDWENDAEEMKEFHVKLKERYSSPPGTGPLRDFRDYFKLGLTWPRKPHERGNFSHLPPGTIFSDSAPYLKTPAKGHWANLAILNSDTYIGLLHLLMPRGGTGSGQTLKYETGYIAAVPIPEIPNEERKALQSIAKDWYFSAAEVDLNNELSRLFTEPALLTVGAGNLDTMLDELAESESQRKRRLSDLRQELNSIARTLYGIRDSDARALEASLVQTPVGGKLEPGSRKWEKKRIREFISYLVGCAFGRWNPDIDPSEVDLDDLADPFQPLPAWPPAAGGPMNRLKETAPLADGIALDDMGHPNDLLKAISSVMDSLSSVDELGSLHEIIKSITTKKPRDWISTSFFKFHCRHYNRNRRKAPVYWQLTSPRGRYSVWVYYPSYSEDTLYYINEEYVKPKLELELRRAEEMEDARTELEGPERRNAEEALQEKQELITDIREFQDLLLEVARLNLKPERDDGVLLNMAPLRKLIPWKTGKGPERYWEELLDGEYPWSSLHEQLKDGGLIDAA